MSEMYTLMFQPYYDSSKECYYNIIIIDRIAKGPLKNSIKQIHLPKLSPFKEDSPCCSSSRCVYGIYDPDDKSKLLCGNDYPYLFSYLVSNGYKINVQLTDMMNKSEIRTNNKILSFITY